MLTDDNTELHSQPPTLDYNQLFEIYKGSRPTLFKPRSFTLFFENVVARVLGSEASCESEKACAIKDETHKAYKKFVHRMQRAGGKYNLVDRTDFGQVVFTCQENGPTPAIPDTEDSEQTGSKRGRPKVSLDDVSSKRHQRRRTDQLRNLILEIAEEQGTTVHFLLGMMLHQMYYHDKDRSLCRTATKLMEFPNIAHDSVSPQVASHLKNYLDMGREKYQRMIRSLKSSGLDVLPSWKKLREYERSITPSPVHLPEKGGVGFNYEEAVTMSTKRILEQSKVPTTSDRELTLEIKDGLDGLGSHSIFNQNGNKSTHNIVMVMFTPLKLTNSNGDTVWSEPSPASPFSCRPLSLILGKETDDAVKKHYHQLAEARTSLQQQPLKLCFKDSTYIITIKLTLSMIDAKMRALLSGLGGAFCLLCTCTRDEAINMYLSFTINRSTDEIKDIWAKLESGELKKKTGDQAVRKGVTQEPIVPWEEIGQVSPLHCLLRTFDFILKLAYHLSAAVFNWSDEEGPLGTHTYRFLKKTKEMMRNELKLDTGLAIDIPDSTGKGGTSTTGNVVHAMLSRESNLCALVKHIPERYKDKFHECVSRLYTICRIYNSELSIDTTAFKTFCKDTKSLVLSSFNPNDKSWIFLTPTVHAVLEHSGDLIEANDNIGLGSFTESGLESNNKILRLIRISLSRKCNQMDNLTDCLCRLWVRSDYEVRNAVPPPRALVSSGQSQIKTAGKKFAFEGLMPFTRLSDYYLNGLVNNKESSDD